MNKKKIIVYADLNCPFCYTLHERLISLGLLSQIDWRSIEHAPSIKYDTNDLHTHAELNSEVTQVREVAPEVNIIIPPARPNSNYAIEMTTQALEIDFHKALKFRTLVYRALWQDGLDFSDPDLIDKFRMEAGLPEIHVTDQTKEFIKTSYEEWDKGEFSRNIPALLTESGNKFLGLPSPEILQASLSSSKEENIDEGAFCYLKPKEKILIATNDDSLINDLSSSLDKDFQVEISQSGEWVYDSCLQANSPDLVLMDIHLEDVDGFLTCSKIKDNTESHNISVILFSTDKDSRQEVKAFDSGANDFIVMPNAKEVINARARVLLRLKRTTDLLEQFSRLDSLTEIPNRREFDRVLEKEWLRAKRENKAISLILLDVDHFKKYNDNYGHPDGDKCLKEIAQTLEQSIRRAHDTVARYGGEEFVIVLPDTDKEGAIRVAEQIRSNINSKAIPHEFSETDKVVTASQGIATIIPTAPFSPRNLIDSADVALYSAKNAGRNRYMINDINE